MAVPPRAPSNPSLDDSFHLMYELRFEGARAWLASCRQEDPYNPLGVAAEAASYLSEQFHHEFPGNPVFEHEFMRLHNR
jgi:hypothetical protein